MSTDHNSIAGLRILIVEDEALIVEEMADRLKWAGCEIVSTTDNGNAAIEAAMALRPDLILMDVRLKGEMDGIRVSELIQRQLLVPIVYLTAHSDHGTLQRVKASGASRLHSKALPHPQPDLRDRRGGPPLQDGAAARGESARPMRRS